MLRKATFQVAALNKDLHKGIEREIFGLLRRAYKPSKIYRGNFLVNFNKSKHFFKHID